MNLNKALIFFASTFLVSCSYMLDWSTGELVSSKDGAKGTFAEKTTIDGATIQKSVLQSCSTCHSGQKQPTLASLDDIRGKIDEVLESVNSNRMPPARAGGPLSDCQKKVLEAWVKSGMPDSSSQTIDDLGEVCGGNVKPPENPPPKPKPPVGPEKPPTELNPKPPVETEKPPAETNPKPPVDPPSEGEKSILDLPLNYDTLAEKIIKPRCNHCHNEDGDGSFYILYPYNALLASDVIGESIKESSFYLTVVATGKGRMPPPKDSGPLSADEIEFIKRWIEAGHPEK